MGDNPIDNRDAIKEVLVEEKRREQGETLRVLDALRRTRKSRGGTGAPLKVPPELAMPIIFTDDDNFDV